MIFTWVRWWFFGKRLDEIVAAHLKMQDELEDYSVRENKRRAEEERRAALLKRRAEARTEKIDQANLLHENFKRLMTQHIAVEETAEGNV